MDKNLKGLEKLPAYRLGRTHIFQSEGSLQWYVRGNRDALINAGALVLIAGQWYAHSDKFDAFVLDVGETAAKQKVAASASA
jgi:hypothetical protein